jgi:hypothetical protein
VEHETDFSRKRDVAENARTTLAAVHTAISKQNEAAEGQSKARKKKK